MQFKCDSDVQDGCHTTKGSLAVIVYDTTSQPNLPTVGVTAM